MSFGHRRIAPAARCSSAIALLFPHHIEPLEQPCGALGDHFIFLDEPLGLVGPGSISVRRAKHRLPCSGGENNVKLPFGYRSKRRLVLQAQSVHGNTRRGAFAGSFGHGGDKYVAKRYNNQVGALLWCRPVPVQIVFLSLEIGAVRSETTRLKPLWCRPKGAPVNPCDRRRSAPRARCPEAQGADS